jgi:putative addiction module CopG family antidote
MFLPFAAAQLTLDGIYSTVDGMNIALTRYFEKLIERLVASGRYNNSSEVVRAGLRILEAEERALSAASYPPGALKHLYTRAEARAERRTAKASTLKVEAE